MEASRHFRVSDEQRERVARELRDHFAAGRLDQDELDERVQKAYSARTEAQLQALVADLPRLPVSQQQRKAELAARRGELQRQMLQQAGGGLVPFGICTAIWVADGAQGAFWPIFVAIFVLIPVIRNLWRLYGPAPELDRVQRDLEQRSRQSGRRRHRY